MATALVLGTLVGLVGCGGSSSTSTSSTSSPSSSPSSSASSSSASSASTASSSGTAASGGTLAAAADKNGKQVVVDAKRMTVYLYEPDGTSTTSPVPAGIKANWPAVTAAGGPTAGTGVESSKITVQAQADGTMQVAYNGHLLYTFIGDSKPGDAAGQGLGGVWFEVSPAGDKLS